MVFSYTTKHAQELHFKTSFYKVNDYKIHQNKRKKKSVIEIELIIKVENGGTLILI